VLEPATVLSLVVNRVGYHKLQYTGDSRYMHFCYLHFCISTVLFLYHEEHQCPICSHDRSCHACPLSCICSFTDLPHHFDSGNYKLRSLMVYHSENPWAFIHFPFYAFDICCDSQEHNLLVQQESPACNSLPN
jgi:hypothetical protein